MTYRVVFTARARADAVEAVPLPGRKIPCRRWPLVYRPGKGHRQAEQDARTASRSPRMNPNSSASPSGRCFMAAAPASFASCSPSKATPSPCTMSATCARADRDVIAQGCKVVESRSVTARPTDGPRSAMGLTPRCSVRPTLQRLVVHPFSQKMFNAVVWRAAPNTSGGDSRPIRKWSS